MAHGTTVLLGFLCFLGLNQFILIADGSQECIYSTYRLSNNPDSIADGSPESNSNNPDLESSTLFLSNYINQTEAGRNLSRVTRCPGICVNDSYSGFLTYKHQHLFFWFFESQKNKSFSPLVVWLNGGPGFTSMIGALLENGPVSVVKNVSDSSVKVERREFNWQNELSILYIDNPVGTGYSFSSDGGRQTKTCGVAETLINVLRQFYLFFPEYMTRELYIGGQSYAGKYVIALADRIDHKNRYTRSRLPLSGIYMGGAIFDPPLMFISNFRMLNAYGAISRAQFREYKRHIKQMEKDYLRGFHRNLTGYNIHLKTHRLKMLTNKYINSDNWYTDNELDLTTIENYMRDNSTRQALHVGRNLTFVAYNFDVFDDFGGDFFQSWTKELGRLLDKNYKVLIYDGDMDMTVSAKGTEASLVENVKWRGHEEYLRTVPIIYIGQVSEDFYQVFGFVKKVQNFCHVTLKGAGHQAPRDRPKAALKMITDFIKTGCVANVTFDLIVN